MAQGVKLGPKAYSLSVALMAGAACLPSSAGFAQDEDVFGWVRERYEGPILPERPTFSRTPQTLPAGRFQVEGGFDIQFDGNGEVDTEIATVPLGLVRYGIFSDLEVQVGWAGVSVISTDGETNVGTGDLDLSLKLNATEQRGRMPNIGFLVNVSLPVGDETGSTNVDPSGGVLWSHALASDLGLFGNVLFGAPSNGDDRFFQFANAIGVSKGLTESLAVFAEYVAEFNTEVIDTHTADFGVTYLLNDNLQLDFNGGVGLSRGTPDAFIGGGVAYRW